MGDRGEDMQQRTRAGFNPGSLKHYYVDDHIKRITTYQTTKIYIFLGDWPFKHLQRQQALVNLGALQAGLTVGAGRVGAALVPRQVDKGELAMHLAPSPQNDLEHGVAAGRVCVGRRLSRGPGRETGPF